MHTALAVVVVRDATLPLGAREAVEAAGGTVLLVGSGTADTDVEHLRAAHVTRWEVGPFAPAAWAQALGATLDGVERIVLPATPDGRDLAPRLAAALGRPLLAGVAELRHGLAHLPRYDRRLMVELDIPERAVLTVAPGAAVVDALAAPTGADPAFRAPALTHGSLPDGSLSSGSLSSGSLRGSPPDPDVLEVLPADPATVDLAEATRIVAGGAGLGSPAAFEQLRVVAAHLGMSMGATRLVADLGWVEHERYIGTTGVSVDPDVYVALGISGAVQHVTGIGHPSVVVSVNTDASSPMSALADLALVTDARALLDELAARLGVGPDPARPAQASA